MRRFFDRVWNRQFCNRFRKPLILLCAVGVLTLSGLFEQSALAQPVQKGAILHDMQPIIGYNIDFGMDIARVEQTIEHYGEEIRDVVEQALRNNVNNPESKDTAQNTYQRQSAMNDLLPERRSSAFSTEDLRKLKNTEHPRDRLK